MFWISIGLLFFADKPVLAADQNPGFALSPFTQEITLAADQARVGFSVSIENKTDAAAKFQVSAVDFGMRDGKGGADFVDQGGQSGEYGLADWMDLENESLELGPGEKRNVSGTIRNDGSLAVGGHYGAVVFRMEGAPGSSSVAFRLASLVFADKAGGEKFGLELEGYDMSKNFLGIPGEVGLRFRNSGNTHLVPRGIVRVTDMFGREVSRGTINPESAVILPETSRSFTVASRKMSAAVFPGYHTVAVEYRFDGKDSFAVDKSEIFLVTAGSLACSVFFSGFIIVGSTILWRKMKNRAKKAQIKALKT